MRKQTQTFITNFFAGVLLEGHPIQAVVINDEEETPGTGVFLISQGSPFHQIELTFPDEWEVPTLISKEAWQAYMEASRAIAEEEQPVLPEYQEYTDPVTKTLLIVERDLPDHPRLTLVFPEGAHLSIDEINRAIERVQKKAGIPSQHRAPSPYTLTI